MQDQKNPAKADGDDPVGDMVFGKPLDINKYVPNPKAIDNLIGGLGAYHAPARDNRTQ